MIIMMVLKSDIFPYEIDILSIQILSEHESPQLSRPSEYIKPLDVLMYVSKP